MGHSRHTPSAPIGAPPFKGSQKRFALAKIFWEKEEPTFQARHSLFSGCPQNASCSDARGTGLGLGSRDLGSLFRLPCVSEADRADILADPGIAGITVGASVILSA